MIGELPEIHLDLNLPPELKTVAAEKNNVAHILGGCDGVLTYGPLPSLIDIWYDNYLVTIDGCYGWTCNKCGGIGVQLEVEGIILKGFEGAIS